MARVAIFNGEKYFYENGQWVNLYGLSASQALASDLYEAYLSQHNAKSKSKAAHLSYSLRVIPNPELCRVLVLEYIEKKPAAVGEELLASVIAACSDMFKNSGFSDLNSLEEGIGYFADAYVQANHAPSRTVKRAVRRLYKYASESNVRSKAVDEFLLLVADWERCGFFANC